MEMAAEMNAHKLNPSKFERLLKLARAWWHDNGLAIALLASVVWIWTLWLMLGVGR